MRQVKEKTYEQKIWRLANVPEKQKKKKGKRKKKKKKMQEK